MSKLYQHICSSCANLLIFDKENQVFNCPACGSRFDYDYFMEDSIIDAAEASIRDGEFASAERDYEFLLAKEPHNAIALRGLILCELKTNNISNIIEPDFEIASPETILHYISEAPENYSDFFGDLKKIIDSYATRKDLLKNIKTQKKKIRNLESDHENVSINWEMVWGIFVVAIIYCFSYLFFESKYMTSRNIHITIGIILVGAIIALGFILRKYIISMKESKIFYATIKEFKQTYSELDDKYTNLYKEEKNLVYSIKIAERHLLNDFGIVKKSKKS